MLQWSGYGSYLLAEDDAQALLLTQEININAT